MLRGALDVVPFNTVKLNDVDPKAWLADVLASLGDIPQARFAELLPWNWSALSRHE